ncbi:hypothetical protein DFA_00193 [Cavenderia fasciculata]|uniref:Uncharacterized protein n=1 Tax=Cavenderia fasciculata TaxID=261658 RepID=F4PXV5_CACFS|nr:uncharacterized protein DFA_00193 [Cavenderia fasciculata]EGG19615.1 hypothetical protein DFA_00193 [Cavenderia fasciculata]|eukprot:XP_004357909.1 hypothetical protein DFA_00193 [Cavenderia fasciculata]
MTLSNRAFENNFDLCCAELIFISKSKSMTLQFLGRQKNDDDVKVKTKVDETLFRRVWNNIVLRRLICSKIKDYLSKEDRAVLISSSAAKTIERYKADTLQFVQSNRLLSIFDCEFLTADLFKLHFDTYCKETSILEVIEAFSHNNRHSRDTWLFRRVIDILKDRGIKPASLSSIYTWRNVIKSNNVELYNYAKSVLPMLERHHFKNYLVSYATQRDHWGVGILPSIPGTAVLAQLLGDLIDLDPTENWLEYVDFSYLAYNGLVDILETIHMHAAPCIPLTVKPPNYRLGHQLNEGTMKVAIQQKQIESIRCLYKVFKIPLSYETLLLAARSCDLSFIIALHNIEPGAGRLYTIFIHVVSSTFNAYVHSNDSQCKDFRKEFIDHVKPLNFIDKRLEQQIINYNAIGKWPRIKYQPTTNTQQYLTMFQQSDKDTNIPSLSFD